MMKRKGLEHEEAVELVRLPRSESLLDDDTIRALSEFGEALRAVMTRLAAEGYSIVDGEVRRINDIQL